MSDTMTREKNPLTDDDIVAFLKANPRFFDENPGVLDAIAPPRQHKKQKGVVDFQQYMVKRLREDRDDVIESARDIVETSRANMNAQARIHTAVLMLLEAHNFEDFIRTITMDMAAILDVDIISLAVETDGGAIPHIDLTGVRPVAPGTIDALLHDSPVILDTAPRGLEVIYGGGATLVKSHALARLNIAHGAPSALLAFGSRDPAMFGRGQGTELVAFLAKVIERSFRSWLGLTRG